MAVLPDARTERGRIALWALPFALLLFSRKPDALLHAELWGDEGWSFYPDAYRHGLSCLLIPAGGYLDTFQRLVGLASQALPLTAVPTAFALTAFAVQLAPALFLLSSRLADAIPSRAVRLALALLYLAVPNAFEFYVNLTNAQWNLALLSLLIVAGRPAASSAGRGLDIVVLTLSGLSGPFMLMLAPVAAWQAMRQPSAQARTRLALAVATALIQVAVLLTLGGGGRSTAPLGAGPRMLAQVLSSQVVLGAEIGWRSTGAVQGLALWRDNWLPSALACLAALVALVALRRGSVLLRQCTLFAALLLTACLLTPQVSLTQPRWEVMTHMPMGNRYFALPVMIWIAMLVSLAADRNRIARAAGLALLAPVLLWAVPHDWPILRMAHTDFQARARRFEAAPPGTRMTFPIVPTGLDPMWLVKKPS